MPSLTGLLDAITANALALGLSPAESLLTFGIMPLPDSSTNEPDDLNPLTDVLYLEGGKIKKIRPKNPKTKVKELLMAADTAVQILGDTLYGKEEKYQFRPTWADCLLADIANELNISGAVLAALLNAVHAQDYCIQYLNTNGFRAWAVKASLDELHPFLDKGIEEIKAYYESKSATQPLRREDRPPRSQGDG